METFSQYIKGNYKVTEDRTQAIWKVIAQDLRTTSLNGPWNT